MFKQLRIIAVLALFAAFTGCSDDDEPVVEPTLEVNYANVAGIWQLSEWNGEAMDADSRYFYIRLSRSQENGSRSYEIYTNLNSFVSEYISGTYELNLEEPNFPLISGTYDYTLSTDDEWAHQFVVSELYQASMKWTAEDDTDEVRVYKRCDEIPADIVDGERL
ncbi:hypothetical protein C8N47_10163 [Mangrovibacterium marinum]|uniref:Lipocalin-like protein n=2 Tax=Mangrovibacterium marinum TaxID=1639118 RepID=A0A2T5C657_9BACT|nr:hypothetical protein C8N47_10163 [Mangrovibacterium marinum]